MTRLITATGLTVRYGGAAALRGVDLRIDAGEIVTVVGPNGSGKTTLLRALLGILPPAEGRVERRPGLRVGYVPQRLAIDRTMPMTAARLLSLPRRLARAEADAALARVGLDRAVARRQIAELSGGQLQRVLLARALAGAPEILVLDEPTQGLDQGGEAAFYRLIADIRAATGCAVLMVSHDLHVVMAASDRVVCLNGHVCCEGAPEAVSAAPAYRALFGFGTVGALALYRHVHDHTHDEGDEGDDGRRHGHADAHDHGHGHGHGRDNANDHGHADAHDHGHAHGHDHGHAHGHGRGHARGGGAARSGGAPLVAAAGAAQTGRAGRDA